jgi:hypothetical protein
MRRQRPRSAHFTTYAMGMRRIGFRFKWNDVAAQREMALSKIDCRARPDTFDVVNLSLVCKQI